MRTFSARQIEGTPWKKPLANLQATAIEGPWKIEFVEGCPTLPAPALNARLGSWTTLPDAANFSGTARYIASFEATGPGRCLLDLGKVVYTARLFLNGKALGISWCGPHVIDIGAALKPSSNLLEIVVTNLAANRIADLDRRKIPWKRFHEINFVNIDYKPFDAATRPVMDSVLSGPVRLLR